MEKAGTDLVASVVRWPKYKEMYKAAFGRMLESRPKIEQLLEWTTPQDVFNWWMEYDVLPGQIDMFEEGLE